MPDLDGLPTSDQVADELLTLTPGLGFADHHTEVLASTTLMMLGFEALAEPDGTDARRTVGLHIALEEAIQSVRRDRLVVGKRRKLPAADLASAILGLPLPNEDPIPGLLTRRRDELAARLKTTGHNVYIHQRAALVFVARALLSAVANPPRLSRHLAPKTETSVRRAPHKDAQPVTLLRLTATYAMQGRTVKYGITERLIRAEVDGVDHYDVRARTLPSTNDNVRIESVLNCRADPETLQKLSDETGTRYILPVMAPEPLKKGGSPWLMATRVIHDEGTNELPIVNVSVTSYGIIEGGLTLRLQFQEGYFPAAIWFYADPANDEDRFKPPPLGALERLDHKVTACGFLEWTYTGFCEYRGKYGIAWRWQ